LSDVGLLLAFCALEEDGCVGTKFVDDLPTGSAGRAGYSVIVDDRDRGHFELWTQLGDSGKNGGALGAVRHPVGSVLHVAAQEYFARSRQDCGAHAKLGVGRIRILHGGPGAAQQSFALSFRKFLFCHRVERAKNLQRLEIGGLIVNREAELQNCFLQMEFVGIVPLVVSGEKPDS
jgi:hypothetical protein